MTTGLIAYKLCTLDFRCEECMFDQVMRNEATAGSRPDYCPAVPSAVALNTEPAQQMKGRCFTISFTAGRKLKTSMKSGSA